MKSGLTDIITVLDRSGSMASVLDDTIGGFNTFVEDQKTVPGTANMTLFQFDDIFETVFDGVPIKEVKPLTKKTYVPRGSTALLDAIGRGIEDTGKRLEKLPEHERPEKVIFVIQTDGHENASQKFDNAKINEMIAHQRDFYSWQFVFLGADQDAIDLARSVGIPTANVMGYADNAAGTAALYTSMTANVRSFRMNTKKDMSWEADQIDKQKKAGAKAK